MTNPLASSDPVNPATAAASAIVSLGERTFRQNVAFHKQVFNLFWNNPRATPQQIAATLGTSAAALFTAHAALGAALNASVPGTIAYTPPSAYTVNPDGSVTIGDPVTPLSEQPGA